METKTLSSAIKKVAISYILIYLHINISVIDILPDWLGYFLIVSVLPILSQKEKSGFFFAVFYLTYANLQFVLFPFDTAKL